MPLPSKRLARRSRTLLTSAVIAAGVFAWSPLNFFGGPGVSANGERAYTALTNAFPAVKTTGQYMGDTIDKTIIAQRFDSISQAVGQDAALVLIEKEPILLLWDAARLADSYQTLKELETDEDRGLALEIIQKNPRILTVSRNEFQRTKPSLSGLQSSASAIDALRPLGQGGLGVAIFVGFIALILIVRPFVYGVNGGPSIISAVLSPVTSMLPPLPNLTEIAESNGISLSAFVILIPIAQTLAVAAGRFGWIKAEQGDKV